MAKITINLEFDHPIDIQAIANIYAALSSNKEFKAGQVDDCDIPELASSLGYIVDRCTTIFNKGDFVASGDSMDWEILSRVLLRLSKDIDTYLKSEDEEYTHE